MTEIRESYRKYVELHPQTVSIKQSKRYPDLFTLKYKPKVFYDGLWDSYLVDFRGTVVDRDFNPIVMPFRKIFNRLETPDSELPRDEQVTAVRKVNGFMAAATYVPHLDEVIVSTTGSLDSKHVEIAEKHITDERKRVIAQNYKDVGERAFTHLFEVVDPDDQAHPIDEAHGLYYLGARRVRWDSSESNVQARYDDMAAELGCFRPEWFTDRYSNIVEHIKIVKHEGFVIHGSKSIKIKSPYYLTTKFIGRMRDTKLEDMVLRPQHYKAQLGEEYNHLIDIIVATKDKFLSLDEHTKFDFVRGILNG